MTAIEVNHAPPFVGRLQEMHAILRDLDEAKAGLPRLVLVSGDAGAGKTRLLNEAMREAERRGFQVCDGRFVESGAVPYYAIASALVPALSSAGLLSAEVLGPGAATLMRVAGLSAPIEETIEVRSGQAALYVALTRAVLALARSRPLLFVIDDLHWAAPEARQALTQVVIGIAEAMRHGPVPICVLMGHRVETQDAALAEAISRLQRETWSSHVHLAGMSEMELGDLVLAALGRTCSPDLLHLLRNATSGNPLFALEGLTALNRQGGLVVDDAFVARAPDVEAVPFPPALTVALRSRLQEIPRRLFDVLLIAAVLDGEFPMETLEVATGEDRSNLIDMVDEAMAMQILVEDGIGFSFAHPLLGNELRRMVTSAHARRLHRQVAARFMAQGETDDADVIRIAHHLILARQEAVPDEQRRWALRAAELSSRTYAWVASSRFYEAALPAPGAARVGSLEDAELLMNAAAAHYHANDLVKSCQRYDDALTVFKQIGDANGWARSLEGWMSLRIVLHGPAALEECVARRRLFRAKAAKDADAAAATEVEIQYAGALYACNDLRAVRAAEASLRFADSEGSARLTAQARFAVGTISIMSLRPRRALQALREALPIAGTLRDPWEQNKPLLNLPCAVFMTGDLQQTRATAEQARGLFADAKQWGREAYATAILAWLAYAEGDFLRCEELVAGGRERMGRADWHQIAIDLLLPVVMGRLCEGRIADAIDAISLLPPTEKEMARYLTRVVRAAGGTPGAAAHDALPAFTLAGLMAAALDVESTWLAGSVNVAPGTRAILEFAARRRVLMVPGVCASVARLRGIEALKRGALQEGRQLLRRATSASRQSGAQLEQAKSELALAESLILERNAAGARLAAKAADTFAEMGAEELLARAQRLAGDRRRAVAQVPPQPPTLSALQIDILIDASIGTSASETASRLTLTPGAVERYRGQLAAIGIGDSSAALNYLRQLDLLPVEPSTPLVTMAEGLRRGRFQVIMFTDIVDSTPTNVAIGDDLYGEMLARHNAIIQAEVQRVGGRVIKGTGDGVMAAFDSCAAALDCTTAFRERFPLTDPRAPGAAFAIRVGLHGGEPLEAGDDLIGIAVTLASRVANQAAAGDILVSDPVRGLSAGLAYAFESRGRLPLKGFDQRVRLFAVRRTRRPL